MAEQTVAVLGAGGTMGFPIARNLARAGFAVRAWNRSREKAEPLREDGAQVLDAPADAARGADIVLTMLADVEAVVETMERALSGLSDGAIWLQMSTIGEAGTERCMELVRDRDVTFVDAPVLGTRAPAEERKLVVMGSGPQGARDRLHELFDAIAQRTMWLGEAGAGSRLKVAVNSWILAIVEGAAESLALAEGMGLDPRLLLEAVEGGSLDLPYLQMKGKAMIDRAFDPSFRLVLATKDASLVAESAERHGLDLPMMRAIRERLEEAVAEHGEEDMAATFLTSAPAGAPA